MVLPVAIIALSTPGAGLFGAAAAPLPAAVPAPTHGDQIAVAGQSYPIPMRSPIALVAATGSVVAELPVPRGYRDTSPAWSPDGRRLAFERQRRAPGGVGYTYSRVMVVAVSEAGKALGRPRTVSVRPRHCDPIGQDASRCFAATPAWSPDGKWIAYRVDGAGGSSQIRVVRPDGARDHGVPGSRIRLDAVLPSWLPDGRLAFSYSPWSKSDWGRHCFVAATSGCGKVWVQRTDGTGQRMFTAGRDAHWSPDGSRVVFTGSNGGVMTASAVGGPTRRLGRGYLADWSRDGSRIVFARMGRWPDGRSAPDPDSVWIMSADGAFATKVRGGATAPAWRP